MNKAESKAILQRRLEDLRQIPTLPAVLAPLLRYLEQPLEDLDLQRVSDMIAQDKALAAQCLQMANSPLFGQWQKVSSVRAAVGALGFQRVREIAMSCGVLNLAPKNSGIDPVFFWEHSLGCALVARHFARSISYPDPSKAYMAGLLHDLGIIVHLWILPKEFQAAFDFARKQGIPLHEAEEEILGFTHCESGRLLAERWELPNDLRGVVALHHTPERATDSPALVGLVELSDLLCRVSGLNYGYIENREVDLVEQTGFALLSQHCQGVQQLDWARLTLELNSYMDEVHALVRAVYRA